MRGKLCRRPLNPGLKPGARNAISPALGSRLGATGYPGRTQRRVDLGAGIVFLGLAALLAADDLT